MSYIVIRTSTRTINVHAFEDGTINAATLRCFTRRSDDAVQLFRNGIALTPFFRDNDFFFDLQRDWCGAEFELKYGSQIEHKPSIFGSPTSTLDLTISKTQKTKDPGEREQAPVDGELAASVRKYALFYYGKVDNYKRCVVPLTRRLAAIYRHGENKSIKLGDEIVIRSLDDKNYVVSTRAVKFIEEIDTIILQSNGSDVWDEDLRLYVTKPKLGMRFLMMGFSIIRDGTNHQSLSNGFIECASCDGSNTFMGSIGCSNFDSGGSYWSENGRLMGMQIDLRKPGSSQSRSRCWFVSINHILGLITDLLPSASE